MGNRQIDNTYQPIDVQVTDFSGYALSTIETGDKVTFDHWSEYCLDSIAENDDEDKQSLRVTEIWENVELLEGENIRVRGKPFFEFSMHPWQVGGCAPNGDNPTITGKLMLFDEGFPGERLELEISESSLNCAGNVCTMTCTPFAPPVEFSISGSPVGNTEAFEFIGTLRVGVQENKTILILENLDLTQSRRLVNGIWEPIPIGEFSYGFP